MGRRAGVTGGGEGKMLTLQKEAGGGKSHAEEGHNTSWVKVVMWDT